MNLTNILKRILRYFKPKNIPNKPPNPDFTETREESRVSSREIKSLQKAENLPIEPSRYPEIYQCPYCSGKNVVKRGTENSITCANS